MITDDPAWADEIDTVLAGTGVQLYRGSTSSLHSSRAVGDRFDLDRSLTLPTDYGFYDQSAERALRGMTFSLCEQDEDIIGAVKIDCEPLDGVFHISHIFVCPDMRNGGVARRLIAACGEVYAWIQTQHADVEWGDIQIDAVSPGGAALQARAARISSAVNRRCAAGAELSDDLA